MKKLASLLCGLLLLAGLSGSGQAFQEYPSLELTPYVGYLLYDGDLSTYQSNLAFGVRLDLRTMAALGFQFNYARCAMAGDFPSQPFGQDEYVELVHLNLTRDLFLARGVYVSGYAGLGSFNRRTEAEYDTDPSIQAGLEARRNLFDMLYLRTSVGWIGAFLKDHDPEAQFAERTLTHHFGFAVTVSFLFDN